jgi:hypothetical protein
MHDSLNSSRTIDKTKVYQDNGDFLKTQSKRVNRRSYNISNMIFDNVILKSVDTDRKMTGCSRSHSLMNNLSNFKLHYEDSEMDTVEKVWQKKQKSYGKLRNFLQKSKADEQYHNIHTRSNKTQPKKFKNDFASSIANVPGSNLSKKKEKIAFPPSKKKMNEPCSSVTYKRHMATKTNFSYQQESESSLSTTHTNLEPVKNIKEPYAKRHRYQFKRVNRLKYKN